MERRVRQSICAVCNKTVGPGKGTVLGFGAGGRVHTQTCLQLHRNQVYRERTTSVERVGLTAKSEAIQPA